MRGARRLPTAALVIACAIVGGGCGKKGPPLTPFVLVPSAPTLEASRRVGDDVILQVVVPAANLDSSTPAAVSRVEVYGVTAMTPPPRTRFLEIATLVATIPVAPAGEPGGPVIAADITKGAPQGGAIVVRDTLSAEEMTPRELPATPESAPARPPTAAAAVPTPRVLRRFYMAFAYSPRNRPGPPSAVTELPLTVLPPRPSEVRVALTPTAIAIDWQPSGGLLGWLLDRALTDEGPPPAIDIRPPAAATTVPTTPPTDWLPGPTRYQVYRDVSPDPLAMPAAAAATGSWQTVVAAPVTAAPLVVLRFDDPVVFDDRERCYYVRALRGGVESEPSLRQCVRAIDIYPPVTPTNVAAITAEGVINLIWEPNIEEDLAGYTVLRREAGGDTLLSLTPTPITTTRFSDRTVKPGVHYTYEVRAVDGRLPVPNASEPAEVSETAR